MKNKIMLNQLYDIRCKIESGRFIDCYNILNELIEKLEIDNELDEDYILQCGMYD